jgi:hypothetical protein
VDPSLYVVLDRTAARGRDLVDLLALALAGGSRMIQLREKEWPSGRLLPLAGGFAPPAPRPAPRSSSTIGSIWPWPSAPTVCTLVEDLPARAAAPLLGPA